MILSCKRLWKSWRKKLDDKNKLRNNIAAENEENENKEAKQRASVRRSEHSRPSRRRQRPGGPEEIESLYDKNTYVENEAKASGENNDSEIEDASATRRIELPSREDKIQRESSHGRSGKKVIVRKKRRRKRSGDKKNRPLWKKILITACIVVLCICFLGGVAGLGVMIKIMSEAPELDLTKLQFVEASKVYDINDDFYQELQSSERREPVTIQEVPELVQLAFVSIEDQRFYSHFGVDIRGTMKAVIGVLTSGGTDGAGGSTITQQLIKQTHLTSEVSVKRKVMEWKLAYQLEKKMSKREILGAYLNKINLSSAWGLESASQLYFGVSCDKLSVSQAACIASIMKAPTYYNPYSYVTAEDGSEHIEKVTDENGKTKVVQSEANAERSKLIVAKMLELGHISQKEHDIAIKEIENNEVGLVVPSYSSDYTYFTDAVYNEVLEDMQEKYSLSYNDAVELMLNGGIKIYATVDPDVQGALDSAAADDSLIAEQSYEAARASEAMSASTGESINYVPEEASVVIENSTGYVAGILGGRTKSGSLTMNRALQKFQTGSTTKPVSVYAPGIDTGIITLATTFDDVPLKFADGWTPKNAGNNIYGMLTVREGLWESENMVATQCEYLVGHEICATYAESFGLEIAREDGLDLNGAALALGGYTYGQTPLVMASAFSVFPNEGVRITPTFYRYVTDSKGNVLLESQQQTTQVIKPQTAWLITDVLHDAAATYAYFTVDGHETAGKTGTTDSNVFAWYCGYTRDYTISVWMGYDQQTVTVDGEEYSLRFGSTGSSYPTWFAKRVVGDFCTRKNLAPSSLPSMPDGIIQASVDKVSGKAPTALSEQDPRGSQVITEYFIEGTYPEGSDDLHREFLICSDTGNLATEYCPHVVKKVLVYKDPSIVYIAGAVPYRDDTKVGSKEVGAIAPDTVCSSHSVDSVVNRFKFGTSPSNTSTLTDSYTMSAGSSDYLYIYTQSITGVTKDASGISPSVSSSNEGVASAYVDGNTLVITAYSQGEADITINNVYNAGVSGVLGIPPAPSKGDTSGTVNCEYSASGTIHISVRGYNPPEPVDPPAGQ